MTCGSRCTAASSTGWDVQREQTIARQKVLGVIPRDPVLTERHAEIPAGEDMDEELKQASSEVAGQSGAGTSESSAAA